MPKQITSIICLCCARDMPKYYYDKSPEICDLCIALPVQEAIKTARATGSREEKAKYAQRSMTQASKQALYLTTGGKRCGDCHALKAPSEYYASRIRGDGLQTVCKQCVGTRNAMQRNGMPTSSWHAVRDALRARNASRPAEQPPSTSSPTTTAGTEIV